jgi:major type 1 subunit fimbrin (pilin)
MRSANEPSYAGGVQSVPLAEDRRTQRKGNYLNMRIASFVLALIVSMNAATAFAADAVMNFNGNILAASCDVDTATASQTIDLKAASISSFTGVGSTSNATAFNVKLLNCSTGAKVTMTLQGTIDTVASVLKNTGTATRVGVQFLQASSVGAITGSAMPLNSAISLGAVDATNTMTIPLVAQMYQLGTMTAGTISATATLNFTYN